VIVKARDREMEFAIDSKVTIEVSRAGTTRRR